MSMLADLHLHSRYSRAVSSEMTVLGIANWARRKGIDLVATGDFLHPLWIREVKVNLEETGNGFLTVRSGFAQDSSPSPALRNQNDVDAGPLFLLSTEISSIYSQGGKVRRIHNLIFASSILDAEKIGRVLIDKGANLGSDGRPIVGLSARDLLELVLGVSPSALMVPAHAWTPWFSLFGSESGFDSIDECFSDMSRYIYAIETGLSSDPAMNWRISELDERSIVSFSDAHSGPKLGREATVFRFRSGLPPRAAAGGPGGLISHRRGPSAVPRDDKTFSYDDFVKAIKREKGGNWEIDCTVEFFPEEGKYHYTGHRNCSIRQSPEETRKLGKTCPVCGKPLTVGVMHRVEELSSRSEEELKIQREINENGVMLVRSGLFPNRPGYTMLVPLMEILAEVLGKLSASKKVLDEYTRLVDKFGSEFKVLLEMSVNEIAAFSGPRVAEAIEKVRKGELSIEPGYDGVFGKVKIWGDTESESGSGVGSSGEQTTLF